MYEYMNGLCYCLHSLLRISVGYLLNEFSRSLGIFKAKRYKYQYGIYIFFKKKHVVWKGKTAEFILERNRRDRKRT